MKSATKRKGAGKSKETKASRAKAILAIEIWFGWTFLEIKNEAPACAQEALRD